VQIITRSKSYFNTIKVPFEEVPDLVASRRVFLSKGYAYVAMSQVCTEYFIIPVIVLIGALYEHTCMIS